MSRVSHAPPPHAIIERELERDVTSDTRLLTDDELIARYIELNPRRPGRDRAQVKDAGVEVWALVAYYQGGAAGDVSEVARAYEIPVEAVRASLAYYTREQDLIDARLKRLRTG
jgi:uncharacterized protein (DUF433 family)